MQRIKLVLEYDGSGYSGWQIQRGQSSIQQELEQAFNTLIKQKVRVNGAGRTDAGVHARNQVAHCDIPDSDLFRLKQSLNGLLNDDIIVKEVQPVTADFHARFDAGSRRYRYTIATEKTALGRFYSWPNRHQLNFTLMQVAAELIRDVEDFKSFCKVKSEVKHYCCQIFHSRWLKQEDLLIYEIEANRFLHGMVRAIVGSLVEIGRGKQTLTEFKQLIQSGDRTRVAATAPARGLVLEEITY